MNFRSLTIPLAITRDNDEEGEEPEIPNSQVRFLIGYQRQLWQDAGLGVQYYAEIMEDYSSYRATLPPGFPAQIEYRDVGTFRLDQLLKYQTWDLKR